MKASSPASVQLIAEECNGYYLTTASWDSGYGKSYETGIRNLITNNFTLVQHEDWDYKTAHEQVKQLIAKGCAPKDVWQKMWGESDDD